MGWLFVLAEGFLDGLLEFVEMLCGALIEELHACVLRIVEMARLHC